MRCRSCGAKLPRDAVYCYNCGAYAKRRPPIRLFITLAAVAASAMLLLYPASPLSIVGRQWSPSAHVLETLEAAGFNASVERDGYVVLNVGKPSVIDLATLEQVLSRVDHRWVILWNGVEKGSEDKAAAVSDILSRFDGVAGVHRVGGVVTVSMNRPSAQQLHIVFTLAGEDVALYIRFI